MNIRPLLSGLLSAALISVSISSAHAGMVGTGQLLAQDARETQVEQVQLFLGRDEVRSQMELLGVDPVLAAERVALMTDSELQQMALNIDELPAGGALGVVIAVLVILLLLELLGITNFFRKV